MTKILSRRGRIYYQIKLCKYFCENGFLLYPYSFEPDLIKKLKHLNESAFDLEDVIKVIKTNGGIKIFCEDGYLNREKSIEKLREIKESEGEWLESRDYEIIIGRLIEDQINKKIENKKKLENEIKNHEIQRKMQQKIEKDDFCDKLKDFMDEGKLSDSTKEYLDGKIKSDKLWGNILREIIFDKEHSLTEIKKLEAELEFLRNKK